MGNAGSQTAAFPAVGQRAGHRSNSPQIVDSGQPGEGGEWDEEHDPDGERGVLILWRERDTAEDFLEEVASVTARPMGPPGAKGTQGVRDNEP